jgi:hypothetical protein
MKEISHKKFLAIRTEKPPSERSESESWQGSEITTRATAMNLGNESEKADQA